MIPLADAQAALATATATVTVTGTTAQATAVFSPNLPVFIGHFPGQPVVPGVATLALLVATFERATKKSAHLVKVGRCKWKSPVLPGDLLEIAIAWEIKAHAVELKGTVSHDLLAVCEAVVTLQMRAD